MSAQPERHEFVPMEGSDLACDRPLNIYGTPCNLPREAEVHGARTGPALCLANGCQGDRRCGAGCNPQWKPRSGPVSEPPAEGGV